MCGKGYGQMKIYKCMNGENVTKIRKHEMVFQCWFNVGPASQTVAQHSTSIG